MPICPPVLAVVLVCLASCYIFAVLPSSEIRWLQRGTIGLMLLTALLALLVVPARHALGEIWPPRVQELVLSSGELQYVPAAVPMAPDSMDHEVVASSFPHSLLALKRLDGEVWYGYAVDLDAEPGLWWVEIGHVLTAVDQATIGEVWAPNGLSLRGRLEVMRTRLEARWRAQSRQPATVEAPEQSAESNDV